MTKMVKGTSTSKIVSLNDKPKLVITKGKKKKKYNKRQRLLRQKFPLKRKIVKPLKNIKTSTNVNDNNANKAESQSLNLKANKKVRNRNDNHSKIIDLSSLPKKRKSDLLTDVTKQEKTKFKPILEIKTPEHYSGNWKQLKDIITAGDKRKKSGEKNSKKTPINPVLKNEPKQSEIPSSDEIWFDDVDPILLQNNSNGTIPNENNSEQTRLKNMNKDSYEATRAIALDCEMVGGGFEGEEDILARVSIVNHYGNEIYDKYVKPSDEVKDYRTHVSGIRPENLVNADPFGAVQKEVSDLMQGRIVVGHALHNDFSCLLLSHPKFLIRDTSKFKKFIKLTGGGRPSLKKLADQILGKKIQTGEHSSVEDAAAAMQLYVLNRKEWEGVIRKKKKKYMNQAKKIEELKDSEDIINKVPFS